MIFCALFIVTIATAFIRIMLQDQMQATANDLSKSALDSAYAGVEDAKRAIVEYYTDQTMTTGKPNCATVEENQNSRCDELRSALFATVATNDGWTNDCQATVDAKVASLSDGEVPVKTGTDNSLNQAYTCLKIQMNPADFVDKIASDKSQVIHLKSLGGAKFDRIKIQWLLAEQKDNSTLDNASPYVLPDTWPTGRPPIIKAQLLQYKPNFHLSDFDSDNNYNASLFLLPSTIGANTAVRTSFGLDFRQNRESGAAQLVNCKDTPPSSRYACEVTIELPNWGDPSTIGERDAYLKLTQFYKETATDFRVTLIDSSSGSEQEVRFAGDVQPAVDATGRANDIFRRIRSRINLGASSVPVAESAVDVTKSLCKEFTVTNDRAYPGTSGVCPPLP